MGMMARTSDHVPTPPGARERARAALERKWKREREEPVVPPEPIEDFVIEVSCTRTELDSILLAAKGYCAGEGRRRRCYRQHPAHREAVREAWESGTAANG